MGRSGAHRNGDTGSTSALPTASFTATCRQDAKRFLASPEGVRWRRRAGWLLIVGLPLVFRLPGLRKHWALRVLELAGGAAVLIKLGEAIRDWDPLAGQEPTTQLELRDWERSTIRIASSSVRYGDGLAAFLRAFLHRRSSEPSRYASRTTGWTY